MRTDDTCGLCLTPMRLDALVYLIDLTTYRTRGQRGDRWTSRQSICGDCWSDTDYTMSSVDGKRIAWKPNVDHGREITDCQHCGRRTSVPVDVRRKVFICSDTCRSAVYRDGCAPAVVTAHCQGCGGEMTGRSDRRFCSSACRQRAYRERDLPA